MSLPNPNATDLPDSIAPTEELGRSVFSRRDTGRSITPARVFLERPHSSEISVDRLTYAPANIATEISDRTARARGRTFYGWAVVTADKATDDRRRVSATPLPDGSNPYHADIILPESVVTNRDEQLYHAQRLADASRWRRRP